jgi:hypothetical protein
MPDAEEALNARQRAASFALTIGAAGEPKAESVRRLSR